MFKTGRIYGINGPVIYLKGNTGFCMSEMVYVGREKLVGEVIALDKDMTTIQVYEETADFAPAKKSLQRNPVSVTLAPGILNNILTESNALWSGSQNPGSVYHPRCFR